MLIRNSITISFFSFYLFLQIRPIVSDRHQSAVAIWNPDDAHCEYLAGKDLCNNIATAAAAAAAAAAFGTRNERSDGDDDDVGVSRRDYK